MLSKEEINNLIAAGEGQHVDFKRSTSKRDIRTMVSFANAKGGCLLIGVEDNGEIVGHELSNAMSSDIQSMARGCDPPLVISISTVALDDLKHITVIDVPTSATKPHRCADGYFLRNGASSEKLTTEELIQLINQEGRLAFDINEVKDVVWSKAFDTDTIQRFRRYIGESVDHLSDEALLKRVGALADSGHPTNAGILFFTQTPARYIPHALVHCVAYNSKDKSSIRDRQNIDTGLISIIDEVFNFLHKHLNVARVIDGVEGTDVLEIPKEALREVLINALIHRDYNLIGGHVMIEVFPDRVSISSPGALPIGLNKENFGTRSIVRNRLLAEIMMRTPFMEKLGTGIDRVRKEITNSGLQEPDFVFDSFVNVTFYRDQQSAVRTGGDKVKDLENELDREYHLLLAMVSKMVDPANDPANDPVSDPVSDPVKTRYASILQLLLLKGLQNRIQIANDLDVPKDTIKRDLAIMRKYKVIEFKGKQKTGGYELTEVARELMDELDV